MNKVKFFGLIEHLAFYAILIAVVAGILTGDMFFLYLAVTCWIISILAHVLESFFEGKSAKKIIFGI